MSTARLRIAFMGTPDYILPVLDAIQNSGHDLVCVYTQPPRQKGRGREVQPSAAQLWAEEKRIPVRTPANFKDENDVAEFQALNLDIAIVAAYGMLLPQVILDAPKHGCINVHPSLLPRWRGTSPVQYTIWAGDAEGGVSVMKLVRQMDAGPIIEMRRIPISDDVTYESLLKTFWAMGADMIGATLKRLAETGTLPAAPQSEDDITFTKMLTKEDGRIKWTLSATAIHRQIRALNPWPGTWTQIEGKRIKILEAEISHAAVGEPGFIIERDGRVMCGQNTGLKILKLQPEGKSVMDFTAAVNGGYVRLGGKFS